MSPPDSAPRTLRTYLESHEVELIACSPDEPRHPHVTIPTPAGGSLFPTKCSPTHTRSSSHPNIRKTNGHPTRCCSMAASHVAPHRRAPPHRRIRLSLTSAMVRTSLRHRRLRFPSLGCHARRLPRRRCLVRRDNSISRRRRRIRPVLDPADGNHPRSPRSETGLRYIDYSQRVDSCAGYASPSGPIDARTRHGSCRGHAHPHLPQRFRPFSFAAGSALTCGFSSSHTTYPNCFRTTISESGG